MKKINNISKEKAQRILFITVLILVFSVFFISLNLIEPKETPNPGGDDPIDQPGDDPQDEQEYETVLAPYTLDTIQTVRKFWSLEQTTEDQVLSLIQFGSTYYISRGVSYSNENQEFNVVASLSGTVKEVTDSPIYGKTVVLEHEDGVETEYISLGSVTVAAGDQVAQGDVLGTSGTNEYDQSALNHVHFRISVDGKYYNPETLIGKTFDKLLEN